MKNIHILPTDKPSRLCKDELGTFHITESMISKVSFFKNQNIYITNDEQIKIGDWVYSIRGFIGKFGSFENSYVNESKKIILTTDQKLIKDNVQAIGDEFLEWFVNNPSCEFVTVTNLYGDFQPVKYDYKIIIPKEEPKQETLEEYFLDKMKEVLLFGNDAQAIRFMEKYFEAKQERSYSEEEVIELIQKALTHEDDGETGSLVTAQGKIRPANFFSWFERFKKK